MLFDARHDYLTPQTIPVTGNYAVTAGVSTRTVNNTLSFGGLSTLKWEITREFPLEGILLLIQWSNGGAASGSTRAKSIDAPFSLIKRVRLTVSDGARTRTPVDISGIGLAECMRQLNGTADAGYYNYVGGDCHAIGTGKSVVLPIMFSLPNLCDPVGGTLMLPMFRYNSNPVLEISLIEPGNIVQFGGFNTSSTTASANYSFSNLQITPILLRREVVNPNWLYYDWELSEQTLSFPNTGPNQMTELQVPGSYSFIGLRGYKTFPAEVTTADSGGNSTHNGGTRGDPTTIGSDVKLQLVGQVIRRLSWQHMAALNQLSQAGSHLAYPGTSPDATVFFDFLSDKLGTEAADLGSLLDTNVLMGSGARPQLVFDIGTAGAQIGLVTHRIFGLLDAAKPRG